MTQKPGGELSRQKQLQAQRPEGADTSCWRESPGEQGPGEQGPGELRLQQDAEAGQAASDSFAIFVQRTLTKYETRSTQYT